MEKLVLFSASCFFFFFLVILNISLVGRSAEVERGTEVLQKLSYEYMSGKGYRAKKPFCYKGSKGNWLKVNIRSTYELTWMMVPSVSTLSSLPSGKRFFTVWSGKVISLRPSGKCFSEAGIKINVEWVGTHVQSPQDKHEKGSSFPTLTSWTFTPKYCCVKITLFYPSSYSKVNIWLL